MKKLFFTVVVIMLTSSVFAQTGKQLYNDYSDKEGVEAVYIGPLMFNMVKHLPVGEFDFASEIIKFNGFYELDIENDDITHKLNKDMDRMVKDNHLEMLMESKEEGDITRIYVAKEDTLVTSFIIIDDMGSDGLNVVIMDATLSENGLNRVVNGMGAN